MFLDLLLEYHLRVSGWSDVPETIVLAHKIGKIPTYSINKFFSMKLSNCLFPFPSPQNFPQKTNAFQAEGNHTIA